MFVVDTNILICAATVENPDHETCHDLLESCRRGVAPWYLTWNIIYEFMRVMTHLRVFEKPATFDDAFTFIQALRAAPSCGILRPTERHADIAAELLPKIPGLRGNLLHDAHTAVLMREHGIRRIVTRDADFHRFDFLEVLDPLGSQP